MYTCPCQLQHIQSVHLMVTGIAAIAATAFVLCALARYATILFRGWPPSEYESDNDD